VRVLLLAPPGAGKGTQAKRISEHFDIPHISTGDLFRRHVAEGTELGRSVQEYLDRGDLVPDDVVLAIIRQAIEEAITSSGGYLLDGFPRNLRQAREGAHIARQFGATADAVLHLEVSEDEVLRRLLGRGSSQGRSDDNEETIRHRLDVYRTQTRPLLDYYRGRGLLIDIDGEQPVDDVTQASIDALEKVRAGDVAPARPQSE
jgi:adenylate kinase